jgi:hypothetical protein
MPVQSRALVPRRHVRQPVRGFDGELLEDLDRSGHSDKLTRPVAVCVPPRRPDTLVMAWSGVMADIPTMTLLLDDFTDAPTDIAARWSVFSDRVMGGVSVARAMLGEVDGRLALRLTGEVSLERNGGFVQMARALGPPSGTPLDASEYAGVSLTVRGTPGSYVVHLRTTDCRAPWQYYTAPLPVSGEWHTCVVPWHVFEPVALREPLDPSRLIRLGIVAAKVAFTADVAVSRVLLVP